MKSPLKIITATAAFLGATQAYSAERYMTFSFAVGKYSNDTGGFNTAGSFSNTDTQSSGAPTVGLKYGLRDNFSIGGLPISTEFDLSYSANETFTSASFPGLPTPTFFYDTEVETIRVGASFWAPVSIGGNYRTEIGLGLGAALRDIQTFDGVVGGNDSDVAPYGSVGLRHSWDVSPSGRFSVSLNYLLIDDVNIALTNGGGSSAGNYSFGSKGLELSAGYTMLFGK